MAHLTKDYGIFLDMVFSTLDRKPITNQETRGNYKSVLLDYCNFLYKLSPLPFHQKFISQKKYIEKLEVMLGRFQSIGSEFLPDDKVESFLTEMQDYMRDWVNDLDKMNSELYKLEKTYYTSLAYDNAKVTHNTHGFMNDQQSSLENLKSKINLPGFKPKYNF